MRALRDAQAVAPSILATVHSDPNAVIVVGKETKNSGPLVMREPEFFDYVSSRDEANVCARCLDERVCGVFWIAAWLLIASGTALTDTFFDALTDGFVNVLPVLDSV